MKDFPFTNVASLLLLAVLFHPFDYLLIVRSNLEKIKSFLENHSKTQDEQQAQLIKLQTARNVIRAFFGDEDQL